MSHRGFTLIEMLIVLSVLGVILVIAIPRMADAYRRRAPRVAADRFTIAHSLARSTAVRYGRLAELHVDAGNVKFWVEVDTSGTGVRDTAGLLHDLGGGTLTMTSPVDTLCFDGRGMATARGSCDGPAATITFSMDGYGDTLTITALGKVLR